MLRRRATVRSVRGRPGAAQKVRLDAESDGTARRNLRIYTVECHWNVRFPGRQTIV